MSVRLCMCVSVHMCVYVCACASLLDRVRVTSGLMLAVESGAGSGPCALGESEITALCPELARAEAQVLSSSLQRVSTGTDNPSMHWSRMALGY